MDKNYGFKRCPFKKFVKYTILLDVNKQLLRSLQQLHFFHTFFQHWDYALLVLSVTFH